MIKTSFAEIHNRKLAKFSRRIVRFVRSRERSMQNRLEGFEHAKNRIRGSKVKIKTVEISEEKLNEAI